MKIVSILISILLPALAIASNGAEKYTPTQIEWLLLQAHARFPKFQISERKFAFAYRAKEPDTIVISAADYQGVNCDVMKSFIEQQKEELRGIAASHDWTWLKLEVDLTLVRRCKR